MTINNNYSNTRTYSNDRPHGRFRNPLNITNLSKTFNKFEDGYLELVKLVPEVKAYGGDSSLYDSVIGNILNTIRDNIPSTSSRNYPNTFSFSIDSHEVGLRTDAGMAFGWRTYFDRDAGEVIYKFRISFITVPTHRKLIIQNMKDEGWEIFETNTQSRFWNKVERKDRRFGSRPNSLYGNDKESINDDLANQLNNTELYKEEEEHEAEPDPTEASSKVEEVAVETNIDINAEVEVKQE